MFCFARRHKCALIFYLALFLFAGYYDTTTVNADMTNFTSLNMDIGSMYPDDSRSPIRDKEESDPLSYNSRPFNTNSSLKGLSETRYDRSDGYTGNETHVRYGQIIFFFQCLCPSPPSIESNVYIHFLFFFFFILSLRMCAFAGIRKRSIERQDSSMLYDDCYGDHDTNDYETSLYPSRINSHPEPSSQLVNRYDYNYGLDRQWNMNSIDFNSHLPSKGKILPKVPIKSYNVIDHREATSTFLTDAIPIASGLSKKTRQLPQPICSGTINSSVSITTNRKRLPKTGYVRQLPQMPSTLKSKYPTSLMSCSDTEYTKFGLTEEFERRGAMSAMQYKDYSYSPSLKTYEPYDDTTKSMNEPSIFHSNDSLNTTAQSVYSEYSTATDRRSKISAISSAIPIASSLTNNLNQVTDSYQNYTSSTSKC